MKYAVLFLVLLAMGSNSSAESVLDNARLENMAINHPVNGNPASYRNDAEELKSIAAYYQNAAYAYARGYAGKIYSRSSNGTYLGKSLGRVIIAVVDSGVDATHADLAANVLKTKAVKCTSAGCKAFSSDTSSHGTNVAGVIAARKNGVGMHGVAFDSYVLPIAALLRDGTGSDILGFNYALDKGAKVINASYGLQGVNGEIPIVAARIGDRDSAATAAQVKSYLSAKEGGLSTYNVIDKVLAKDAIVVFAAGNAGMDQVGMLAGLPYYFRGNLASKPSGYTTVNPLNKDLSKNWVAAGAVNLTVSGSRITYSLAPYSNRCGVAKDWCLVAPFAAASGYLDKVIYTTKKGGGYQYNMGTSFAAPAVSGAIAILKGAFPHLKSKDIMNVLYNTATDIGAAGVDVVYGRGMINLDKATNPSDSKWKITLANSYTLATSSFSSSGLNLTSAFGNVLSKVADEEIMFLDEYDKNYNISLGALLGQSSTNRVAADQMLAELGEGELSSRINFGDGFEVGFAKSSESYDNMGRIQDPALDTENDFKASFSSTSGSKKETFITNKFTHNLNLANEASSSVLDTNISNQFSHSQAFKNPYLGIAESVDAGMLSYKKHGLGFKSGAFFGEAGKDDYEFNNDKGIKGAFSEISYSKKGSGVALGFGVNLEDNTFLGAESNGALNLGNNAKTFYANLGGKYKVTSRLALLGSYNIGVTKMDLANNSLFKNSEKIVTDSFSFGGEYNGLVNRDDSLLLSVSQPLRVRSGSANLALPTSINEDGIIGYTNKNLDLSPEGREINLEAYYKTPLDNSDAELKLGSVYRINPDHYKNAENEGLFLAKFKQSF